MEVNDERQPLLNDQGSRDPHGIERERKRTPLPWGPIGILLFVGALGPLAYELVFPFINQMLVELEVVTDPERVGFYSGIIESVFFLASLVTILPMSYASGRFGRKPVMVFGILGLAISQITFGTSRTFEMLVLARCLSGGLGGVSAIVKSMIGELTDKTNQTVAFSTLTLTYRIGQIVGLPIGGLLAHPERHLPSVFNTPFWLYRPYLLPCCAGAGFALVGVTLVTIFLKDTAPRRARFRSGSESMSTEPKNMDEFGIQVQAEPHPPQARSDEEQQQVFEEAPRVMELLKNKDVLTLVISNLAMCLISELLFNVYPLFAYTPIESGGLGLSEADIGVQMSIRAMLILFTVGLFNSIYHWLGHSTVVHMYQYAMGLWPILAILFPLSNFIARRNGHSWLLNIVMGVFFLVWGFAEYCWMCTSMMTQDFSPSASALVVINGIVQASLTVPQVITPVLSNSMFAYSINHEILGGQLVWVVFFAIGCCSAVHSLSLREPTHDWRAPPETADT